MASRLTRRDPQPFLWPNHVDLISQTIVNVATGRTPRAMICMPPRHGKSETTSKWGPSWYLELWPWKRVMLGAYGSDFAADWGRKVRNLIENYRHSLTVRIADDSSAADRWNTTRGGGMMSAGIGGQFTGRGADLLIVDDPIKNSKDANSAVMRDAVWDWWTSAALTRLEPGAGVILMMTRWHVDDLMGRILKDRKERAKWNVLSLPALALENDPLGRQPGQALWPERYDEAALQERREGVGPYVWDALYQQQPPENAGGEVYYGFTPANVNDTLELSRHLPLQLSIDFNIDPGCHGEVGQYFPDRRLVTTVHELHTPRMHAKLLIKALAELVQSLGGWQWPELHLFGDASGNAQSSATGESAWEIVAAEVRKLGWPFRIRVPSSNPPVADRVHAMNNALTDVHGKHHYEIHPRCERIVTDLQEMRWNGNKLDKRDQDISHPSDADGYRVEYLMPIRYDMDDSQHANNDAVEVL